MFRTMCSHSDKSKCDCLQFLNLHTLKGIANSELRALAKDTQYTRRLVGEKESESTGKRTVKVSDAPIEDTKRNLLAAAAEKGEEQPDFIDFCVLSPS